MKRTLITLATTTMAAAAFVGPPAISTTVAMKACDITEVLTRDHSIDLPDGGPGRDGVCGDNKDALRSAQRKEICPTGQVIVTP